METREVVARLIAIFADAEKEHPDYIVEGVLDPVSSKVIDLCLDALGVPEDTAEDYPDDDERAFCRDWYWSALHDGELAELFSGVEDLRSAGFIK